MAAAYRMQKQHMDDDAALLPKDSQAFETSSDHLLSARKALADHKIPLKYIIPHWSHSLIAILHSG